MEETRVGTRDLKNKLSEYLRRVKAGETIAVTEHGKTIGQIVPILPDLASRLKSMAASGASEWSGEKLGDYQALAAIKGETQLSDLVVAMRE